MLNELTELFETGVREGLDGWQARFTIGVQTFYLQPVEDESKARWYADMLTIALSKLVQASAKTDSLNKPEA